MATTQATVSYSYSLNTSLQIGDFLYCTCVVSTTDGFHVSTAPPLLFGEVTEITDTYIGFSYTSFGNGLPDLIPCTGGTRFLSFGKDKAVNKTSLKGYYNSVTFLNDDNNNEAELFMVNSETTFSSK